MKRLVAAASIAILMAGTAFAADDEPIKRPDRPSKSYRVGVLEPNMSIPHFVAQAYGFVEEADKLGRIRSDDDEQGRLQGEFMVKALNGAGNVVMMSGVSGNSAFINRAKGFQDYVAKHPGIKILSEQWTPNATDRGLKLMEDWSQTFPKIDGVYSGADRLAIGAAQALLAQGKKPGQVVITTVDYNDDTERLVREGWISAATAQTPVLMGRWGIRVAVAALEKKPIPDKLFTPIYVVTKETADKVDISAVRQPKRWRPPL